MRLWRLGASANQSERESDRESLRIVPGVGPSRGRIPVVTTRIPASVTPRGTLDLAENVREAALRIIINVTRAVIGRNVARGDKQPRGISGEMTVQRGQELRRGVHRIEPVQAARWVRPPFHQAPPSRSYACGASVCPFENTYTELRQFGLKDREPGCPKEAVFDIPQTRHKFLFCARDHTSGTFYHLLEISDCPV